MATYFYDRNGGGTAGFGTLTGNFTGLTSGTNSWNNTGSGIGTISDWVAGNTAAFGGTSNTATGGIVTVAGTVSLDGITVQRLTTVTTQTLTGGTLNFGAVNAAFSVGATGSGDLTITSAVSGTNGFTKTGGGALSFNGNTAATSGMSGTITLSNGLIVIGPTTTGVVAFGSGTSWVLNSILVPRPNIANGTLTINGSFSGSSRIQHNSDAGFNTSTTLTGSVASLAEIRANAGGGTATINAIDFPSTAATVASEGTAGATINVGQIASQTAATNLQFSRVSVTTGTLALNVNNSSYTFTTSGRIDRTDSVASNMAISLGGTGNLVVNGDANNLSANPVNITKTDSGSVTLNGINTALGNSTVAINNNGGTLRLGNSNALTGAAGITVGTTSALELTSGITIAKPVASSGTVRNVSGDNTLTGTFTLGGAATLDSTAGTLTLNAASSITGAFALSTDGAGNHDIRTLIATSTGTFTKNGAGTTTLTNTANTFSGAVALNAGILEVKSLESAGAASSLGTGATTPAISFAGGSTLKYSGINTASTSRTLTFTGATAAVTLEASGTAPVNYQSASFASGARTLTLTGTNTSFNTFAAALPSNASAISKSGAGKWILTGANANTGNATITDGTLMVSNASAGALFGTGDVTVDASTYVAKIQIGADGAQAGKCSYKNLIITGGTAGRRSKLRIGGSAVNPTMKLAGNFVLPTGSDKAKFDLSATLFKTPGTYRLIEFVSGDVTGGTAEANIEAVGLAPGMQASFARVAGTPICVNVTISKI